MQAEDNGILAAPTVTGVSMIVIAVKHLDHPGQVGVELVGVAGPLDSSPAVVGRVLKDFGAGLLRAAGVPAIALP